MILETDCFEYDPFGIYKYEFNTKTNIIDICVEVFKPLEYINVTLVIKSDYDRRASGFWKILYNKIIGA